LPLPPPSFSFKVLVHAELLVSIPFALILVFSSAPLLSTSSTSSLLSYLSPIFPPFLSVLVNSGPPLLFPIYDSLRKLFPVLPFCFYFLLLQLRFLPWLNHVTFELIRDL